MWLYDPARHMSRTHRQVEARIRRLKQDIAALDEIRPGSLSQQYNVCGKKSCGCKEDPPRKHGPYYQVSFTWRGKSSTRFVRKQELATVKRQLKNYGRLRALTDEWIELSLDLSKLRNHGPGVTRPA